MARTPDGSSRPPGRRGSRLIGPLVTGPVIAPLPLDVCGDPEERTPRGPTSGTVTLSDPLSEGPTRPDSQCLRAYPVR
jgi:hypothetical protein